MSGPDADDFDARLAEARDKQLEATRREAFVQGFIAAREPKSASAALLLCAEADEAYINWRSHR